MNEHIQHVRLVIVACMNLVQEVVGREPSWDALASLHQIELDAGEASSLIRAARARHRCSDHFLSDQCPPECGEGQLADRMDAYLREHPVPPEEGVSSRVLSRAVDLVMAGRRVVVGTDGRIEAE